MFYIKNKKEYFISIPNYGFRNYTDIYNKLSNEEIKTDCYTLNFDECLKCSNCGIGIKGSEASCIPGDVYGPLFDYTMDNWIYTNDYEGYIFDKKYTKMYKPWNKDHIYIIADPIAKSTLQ